MLHLATRSLRPRRAAWSAGIATAAGYTIALQQSKAAQCERLTATRDGHDRGATLTAAMHGKACQLEGGVGAEASAGRGELLLAAAALSARAEDAAALAGGALLILVGAFQRFLSPRLTRALLSALAGGAAWLGVAQLGGGQRTGQSVKRLCKVYYSKSAGAKPSWQVWFSPRWRVVSRSVSWSADEGQPPSGWARALLPSWVNLWLNPTGGVMLTELRGYWESAPQKLRAGDGAAEPAARGVATVVLQDLGSGPRLRGGRGRGGNARGTRSIAFAALELAGGEQLVIADERRVCCAGSANSMETELFFRLASSRSAEDAELALGLERLDYDAYD